MKTYQGKCIDARRQYENQYLRNVYGTELKMNCDGMFIDNIKVDPNTLRIIYPTVSKEDRVEFVGEIMDVFDDFLERHNIRIPESDKQNEEGNGCFENNPVRLYGDVYSEISDEIENILYQWHVLEE